MNDKTYEIHGLRVLEYTGERNSIRSVQQAMDLIAEANHQQASLVIIPVESLDEDFFQLRTGLAGEILQKFVTYGSRLAIVGDISGYLQESRAFCDLVREANRGKQCWFVKTPEEIRLRWNAPS